MTGEEVAVQILLPQGDPAGLRIVTKPNWSGQGLVFPRPLLAAARRRPEMIPPRAGVYLLWGPDESGPLPRGYIGKGRDVMKRMDEQGRQKDFWTHALCFTSTDVSLDTAQVEYLEAKLIELAAAAKRCKLDNSNTPPVPHLPPGAAAGAKAFLADLLLCLSVVGIDLFAKTEVRAPDEVVLLLRAKKIGAQGLDHPEGFVVLAGGTASKNETKDFPSHLKELRKTLEERGVLRDEGEFYRLTEAYTFRSPSAASGFLLGSPSNGRIDWKWEDDKGLRPLKDLQDKRAEAPDP